MIRGINRSAERGEGLGSFAASIACRMPRRISGRPGLAGRTTSLVRHRFEAHAGPHRRHAVKTPMEELLGAAGVRAGKDRAVEPRLSGSARPPRAAERTPDHPAGQAQAVWLSHGVHAKRVRESFRVNVKVLEHFYREDCGGSEIDPGDRTPRA